MLDQVPNVVPESHSTGTIGALMAMCMTLFKLLEVGSTYLFKRLRVSHEKSNPTVVQLDPDVTRMLREVHEASVNSDHILSLHDNDGVPLAYVPRSLVKLQEEQVDLTRDLLRTSEKIADGQDRLSERLLGRFDDVDRELRQVLDKKDS